jgi:hypothetical protein
VAPYIEDIGARLVRALVKHLSDHESDTQMKKEGTFDIFCSRRHHFDFDIPLENRILDKHELDMQGM